MHCVTEKMTRGSKSPSHISALNRSLSPDPTALKSGFAALPPVLIKEAGLGGKQRKEVYSGGHIGKRASGEVADTPNSIFKVPPEA